MRKQFVKKMEKKLIQERDKIISAASNESNNQNIDVDGDEADEIQANLLIYVFEKLNARNALLISKINEALLKIKKEEYGTCVDCEEEISEKRLEFNPHFDTCIKCAENREKELKQTRH